MSIRVPRGNEAAQEEALQEKIDKLPYGVERLEPFGIRIIGPDTPQPYALQLVRDGVITDSFLEEVKLIVFEKERPGSHPDEEFVDNDGYSQRPHYDGSSLIENRSDAAALYLTRQHLPRNSTTGFGRIREVFTAMGECLIAPYAKGEPNLLLRDDQLPNIRAEIRKAVSERYNGILDLFDSPFTDTCGKTMTWEDLFFRAGVSIRLSIHQVDALAQALKKKGVIYEHHWSPDQMILFHNRALAHFRIGHPGDVGKKCGKLGSIYLDKTADGLFQIRPPTSKTEYVTLK